MKKILLYTAVCVLFSSAQGARAAGTRGVPPEIRENGIAVIDAYAGGGRKVRFFNTDAALAGRLWREYAPIFGETNWDNADPALRHEIIVISMDSREIVLSSRHRITEANSDLVVTAPHAIVRLAGRTREEVLRTVPPEFLARREAFERLLAECEALNAAGSAPAASASLPERQTAAESPPAANPTPEPQPDAAAVQPAAYQLSGDYPARMQAQREQLRAHERKRLIRRFTPPIGGLLFVLGISFPWFIPLLMARRAGLKAGLDSPWWLLAALVLSPLGWVSAVSVTSVTKGLIILSALAPAACALLLRLLPRNQEESPGKTSEWGLAAALMLYCAWGAAGAMAWHSATFSAGSNEKSAIGQLDGLRSNIQVYYGDKDGTEFPAGLHELIPRYMDSIPRINSQGRDRILHKTSDRVAYFRSKAEADDKGGWGYVNEPTLPDGRTNPEYGSVFINCTHMDLREAKRLCDY